MPRIESITVFCGRVTLWLEGGDSQSDYFPALNDRSQRDAVRLVAEYGPTPGCMVRAVNGRMAGHVPAGDYVRAQKLAARIGLPVREDVRFQNRATPAEALADFALEPGLQLAVCYIGQAYCDDPNRFGPCYRAVVASEAAGMGQII